MRLSSVPGSSWLQAPVLTGQLDAGRSDAVDRRGRASVQGFGFDRAFGFEPLDGGVVRREADRHADELPGGGEV